MAPVLQCIYTAHAIIILNQASDCVSNFHNQGHEELCCYIITNYNSICRLNLCTCIYIYNLFYHDHYL